MSDIIISGEDRREPAFVVGKKCRPTEQMILLAGQLLFLRKPEAVGNLQYIQSPGPAFGFVGIIRYVIPLPTFPKRIGQLIVESFMPGKTSLLTADALEHLDPWCYPPGFPEKAVSLLES